KNISLTVNEGDFIAIMGPSGAGKTTLLNLMSTLDKQTSGEIILDGINISKVKNNELSKLRREKIGFIF
ncbi:bacitracin ABC transporter ATP-binding protein, partial [Clostridioides difficile]